MPLYLGVEIILGITLFNKFSGLFGLLALFTGHPLSLLQWISYLWSFMTLIVYVQGLYMVHHPQLYPYCQILATYTIDSAVTCIFTLCFTTVWFQNDNTPSDGKSANEGNKQGASEGYEYGVSMLITLISLIARFYYNFVLASFVNALLRNPRFLVDDEQDDVLQDLKNQPIWRRWWLATQRTSFRVCRRMLI